LARENQTWDHKRHGEIVGPQTYFGDENSFVAFDVAEGDKVVEPVAESLAEN
jgi:hypothetical protein